MPVFKKKLNEMTVKLGMHGRLQGIRHSRTKLEDSLLWFCDRFQYRL